MAKKKSLFETPEKPVISLGERIARYEESVKRSHGSYVFRAYSMQPDVSLPWYEEVLDLERRGKPTTPAAHDLAIEAKHRRGSVSYREPGSDDE